MTLSPEPLCFYGIYRGKVVCDVDPEGRGRITALVPQVFGPTTVSNWAWPCWDVGSSGVPAPGQGVWIMFEGGDKDYPVWVGTWPGGM